MLSHSTLKAQTPQGAAALGSAAAGMQPNPAVPPTATHRPHIPQGISSAAYTALVVMPYILACHPAPASLRMNGLLHLSAGRSEGGCSLDCLQRELWQSQVLSSAEHARPEALQSTAVQVGPALSCPC